MPRMDDAPQTCVRRARWDGQHGHALSMARTLPDDDEDDEEDIDDEESSVRATSSRSIPRSRAGKNTRTGLNCSPPWSSGKSPIHNPLVYHVLPHLAKSRLRTGRLRYAAHTYRARCGMMGSDGVRTHAWIHGQVCYYRSGGEPCR